MRHSDKQNVHSLYKTGDIGTKSIPFLEHYITEYSQNEYLQRIESTSNTLRFWFGHTPIHLIPFKSLHPLTKLITIIRNPKDQITSEYHYNNRLFEIWPGLGDPTKMKATMDDYISYFIRGIHVSGCYFQFYKDYWKSYKTQYCQQFGDINLLIIYYEDIAQKDDVGLVKDNVKKIAEFLEKDGDLNEDDYDGIIENISFDTMKKELIDNPQSFELGGNLLPRKGVINDWENWLNEEQASLIDETMYFKWAQGGNDIRYYQMLINSDEFNGCDNGFLRFT